MTVMQTSCIKTICLILCLMLAGCSGGRAPVYSIGEPGTYVVREKDTLYSIAFRYNLDYKSIAGINRIKPPYTIFPGQKLRLRGVALRVAQDSGPTDTGKGRKAKKKRKSTAPAKKAAAPPRKIAAWHWPLDGKVTSTFSLVKPINKGIDIAGKEGGDVRAAAEGVVVYAGGNLRGYGKLIIIKHGDRFLSAYGNNAAILVAENDTVPAGKVIAKVGRNIADLTQLHFEIRVDGIPKNPMAYLPRR